MFISSENLKNIVNKYSAYLIHKRINDIVLMNSRLFLFFFKKEETQLIVDLDNNNPHIGLLKSNFNELSLPSEFIARAMSKGSPLIENIEVINDDRIIKITTSASDAYYHKHNYFLYIELINAHANMILTDEDNIIITAFYETNINAPRQIIKNFKYETALKKNNNNVNSNFSFTAYQKYVEESFNNSLDKRKKELYGPYLKKYEKKVKALENKMKKIKLSNANAKSLDKYKDYGNTLLMHINEIKKNATSFNDIKLDPRKSISENINIYFNKYKKMKRTIETTDAILKNVEDELEENKYFLDIFKLGKEDDIKNFIDIDYKKIKKKDNVKTYLPYYINIKDVRCYYGKNIIQNDYLTFKMFKAKSEVTWLHLKDIPSSHMIINIDNPSNEILDIASSILLIINKMNSGEIMYTKRKNITRSSSLAKVNVLEYKSIIMRKINTKAYEYIKKERRVNE